MPSQVTWVMSDHSKYLETLLRLQQAMVFPCHTDSGKARILKVVLEDLSSILSTVFESEGLADLWSSIHKKSFEFMTKKQGKGKGFAFSNVSCSYTRCLLKLDIKWLGNVTHFVHFSQVNCIYTGDFRVIVSDSDRISDRLHIYFLTSKFIKLS